MVSNSRIVPVYYTLQMINISGPSILTSFTRSMSKFDVYVLCSAEIDLSPSYTPHKPVKNVFIPSYYYTLYYYCIIKYNIVSV